MLCFKVTQNASCRSFYIHFVTSIQHISQFVFIFKKPLVDIRNTTLEKVFCVYLIFVHPVRLNNYILVEF